MAEPIDPDEPVGYLALPRGTPVVASDGVVVGTVQKVRHHERERIFDGLVVQAPDGRRFVDAPEVGFMTRRQVDITITAAEFVALPPAGGLVGSIEADARRALRRLSRSMPGG